jgi:hypothetical protein
VKINKKEALIHKIITILEKNRGYGIETIEMGLLELSCLSLGEFIYTNKKRLNWVICYAGRVLANYICRRFFIVDWFQEFAKDSKT